MGTDMESIQNAYQGFAKQNYTMLDNLKLGYGGTKEEMQRLIKDAAKNKKAQKELGVAVDGTSLSYGNIVNAIHVVQKEMGILGTTQREADKTIQGSLNSMKSAWKNLLVGLVKGGDDFDQYLDNFIDSVVTFKGNIMPAIEKALSGIGTLIEKLAPEIEKHFPKLVKELLPPLLKAATSLLKGLIKALPSIVSTIAGELPTILREVGDALLEAFEDVPIIGNIGKLFKNNADKIANATTKVIIPAVIALVGALKGLKAIKSITSVFGGAKGGAAGKSGILSSFQELAKMKTKTVLQGVANLGIILGALGALLWIATKVFKNGINFKEMLQVIVLVGILGLVGAGLGKLAGYIGKIKITTVVKGLANMAIILAGMGALLWVATKVFKNGIDFKEMLQVIALIGILGVVGTVLAALAGLIGLIPVPVVALGLANIAIIIGGLGALLWIATKVFKNGIDFTEMLQVIELIGILGVVGSVLAALAGIVGLIPFPLVLAGLANIATAIVGVEAILVAMGALSKIPGFKSLIESGGELLAITFKAIGKAIGSLVGGLAEGITSSLPAIGENFAGFAKALSGTNFEPVKSFFSALSSIGNLPSAGGFFQMFTGSPYAGLMRLVPLLPMLAVSARAFMAIVGGITNFSPLESLLKALAAVGGLPSAGGFFQLFTGSPYEGLLAMIGLLPRLAVSASMFMTIVGGITDFSPISSLLNALASVKQLPSAGGFFQLFTGDPYKGLLAMIVLLPRLGVAVGLFFGGVGAIKDFSPITNLMNALASVKELPKAGGFAQLFTGSPYKALAALIFELPALGSSVGAFFNNLGGITEFSPIPNLMNALASVKDLPKAGGFAQLFTGSAYTALGAMILELPALGKAVASFFDSVKNISDFSKISALFTELGKLDSTVGKKGGVFGAIKSYFSGSEDNAIVILGRALKSFGEDTKQFFLSVNSLSLSNLNGMWSSLKGASNISADVLKNVASDADKIVDKVSSLPQRMAEGLKKSASSLSTVMASIWKDAVKASVAPVNKLLDGANWILKEFGSNKKIATWKPYARGTDGHKGGNALVNDGNGAELVQMPNGYAFIPKGRNVLIPNAPKGMKVLPAGQTANLMGKSSPTFRYAKGVGNLDIWSFIDNTEGLINKVAEKFVNYKGMSKFPLDAGKAMVSTVKGVMSPWVKKLFDEEGGKSLASYIAGKGVEQWRSTVIQALKMEGQYTEANVKRTLYQMQTESGGNPRAINLWDSNAKKGIPSKGLMQCIDPTFNSYARPGFNKNIYDPLSNILASIRYAVARYGSLARAYQGHGYANGGIATRPSIFGEDGMEMAIPLSRDKRNRAVGLWHKAGEMLGLSSYTPENSTTSSPSSRTTENNTYSPQFTLNISGTSDDRTMARKVKRWVMEAMEETFESLERKSSRVQEI